MNDDDQSASDSAPCTGHGGADEGSHNPAHSPGDKKSFHAAGQPWHYRGVFQCRFDSAAGENRWYSIRCEVDVNKNGNWEPSPNQGFIIGY